MFVGLLCEAANFAGLWLACGLFTRSRRGKWELTIGHLTSTVHIAQQANSQLTLIYLPRPLGPWEIVEIAIIQSLF